MCVFKKVLFNKMDMGCLLVNTNCLIRTHYRLQRDFYRLPLKMNNDGRKYSEHCTQFLQVPLEVSTEDEVAYSALEKITKKLNRHYMLPEYATYR